MHNSATRLRLISRIIVIALVILVGVIVAIHDHVSGSGGHAATPTVTPASSGLVGDGPTALALDTSANVISVVTVAARTGAAAAILGPM
jgi:hypothetical protein